MSAQQILQSESKRLKYACNLASVADVNTLTPKQVAALWKGLRGFQGLPQTEPGDIGIAVVGSEETRKKVREGWRAAAIQNLELMQHEARILLTRAAAGEVVSASMKGETTINGPDVRFAGNVIEVFRMLLALLLTTSKVGPNVRRCPECGQFFVRVRRQIYCRDQCTDRATWRNYPEEKKRRARKPQYEKNGWTQGARPRRLK